MKQIFLTLLLAAGMASVIVKPFKSQKLLDEVARWAKPARA